jgi:hypothetical protein
MQTAATSTEIYSLLFTLNPETNTNGLVFIEIETRKPITGFFNSINWTAGSYFIKAENDPSCGTNFIITGTSELISELNALHNNTANLGAYTEDVMPKVHFNTGSYLDIYVPKNARIPISSWINFDEGDPTSNYNPTTRVFTILIAGYYLVSGHKDWLSAAIASYVTLVINKNGAFVAESYQNIVFNQNVSGNGILIERSFLAGDKITAAAYQSTNNKMRLFIHNSNFSIHLIHN